MGQKYDLERLLGDLLSIVKTNLNTKLNEIQAEKTTLLGAANFAVPPIAEGAWFDTLDDKTVNFDPYVYFGVNDNTVIELASAETSEFAIFFTVVLHNNNEDANVYKKMLRYIRALQEVVSENFDRIPEVARFQVRTVTPNDLKDLDGDTFHKIGGIVINTVIA
jgi:hypothetical protein